VPLSNRALQGSDDRFFKWGQNLISEILIRSISEGRCCVEHQPSGARLDTDLPPEYGGAGCSLSKQPMVALRYE